MELCFPKALEPANLFILSSFGGMVSVPSHVLVLLSYFPTFCGSSAVKEELYYQTVWVAMVEVFFHLALCKNQLA
jgi:hypothetical protein